MIDHKQLPITPKSEKSDIFERSVDPIIMTSSLKYQIFESPNFDIPNDHNNYLQRRASLSLSPCSSHILTENFIPSCLDATTEILSNGDVDLDSVNVLSTTTTRRSSRSSSLVAISSLSPASPPTISKHRNSSVSRRLSEIYFQKRHQQQQHEDANNEVVPFYSYYDMINAEKNFNSRQSSFTDEDMSYINDSNLDNIFLDADGGEGEGVDDLKAFSPCGNKENGNGGVEEEEQLSMCSMGQLLRCKSCELRGK